MRLFLVFVFFTITVWAMPVASPYSSTQEQQETAVEQSAEENFEDEFSDEFQEITDEELYDPFEGYNRSMTTFNDYMYTNILSPVATGYAYVVPEGGREGINNMFENIFFPIRFVNNILQLKFMNALEETGRFVVNSTFGLLGFFDPAETELNWEAHKEDFGQTLGYWGVGPGPHIVLPILGPSNLRDTIALVPDYMLDPTTAYFTDFDNTIPDDFWETVAIRSFYWVNKTSLHLGEYENLKKDAVDLYPFLRDIYEQKRIKEIEE